MNPREKGRRSKTYLGEADVLRFLPEALAANVEAIFPDQSSLVGADTAKRRAKFSSAFSRDVAKAKVDIGCGVEERREE